MTHADIGSLLRRATARLAAAGLSSPRVDAELLLAHLLDRPRAQLLTSELSQPQRATVPHDFDDLLARRAAREPLQHIVGRAPFRHLYLEVGPGVFVPRPETELLVDAVLAGLPDTDDRSIVVDLCAGSGALALALATERRGLTVHAVDFSPAALAWLERNRAATRPAPGSSVTVVEGDVHDPDLLAQLTGRCAVVISNPPYVPASTAVSPEVRADPDQAVFAGADGLTVIAAVIARAGALLEPGGLLALEHDDTHQAVVPERLRADGRFGDIVGHRDLAGAPRFVTARRATRGSAEAGARP